MFLIAVAISACSFGATVYTIPGTYATISAAITALNLPGGVPAGGVTFDVAAGYTETLTAPLSITATGTATDQIIFQKNPATSGANPLITAYVGTGTPGTAVQDGMCNLIASDYVFFFCVAVDFMQRILSFELLYFILLLL